jgi:hypothetical protein
VSDAQLLERHVRRFNEGVRSGDWEPMLALFADDATLCFENLDAGPYVGLDSIRTAYRERPPDDEIRLLGMQAEGEHRLVAGFAWSRGGTGRMVMTHERGAISTLEIRFD